MIKIKKAEYTAKLTYFQWLFHAFLWPDNKKPSKLPLPWQPDVAGNNETNPNNI